METYEKFVKEKMQDIVERHRHNHPLYLSEKIDKSIIQSNRAAFVLFEQIDTDRRTAEGEGWLGDQFRYSVWYMEGENDEPRMLYEDHAYIRPRTISALTGTRGRDCRIDLEELIDQGIILDISTEEKGESDSYKRKKVLLDFNGKIHPASEIPKKSKLKTTWLK